MSVLPIVKYGKGGGLYKTTDGGKNWKKLDKGLPNVATGRIGLDYYRKDPNVVFAVIDSEKSGTGFESSAAMGLAPVNMTGRWQFAQPMVVNSFAPFLAESVKAGTGRGARDPPRLGLRRCETHDDDGERETLHHGDPSAGLKACATLPT